MRLAIISRLTFMDWTSPGRAFEERMNNPIAPMLEQSQFNVLKTFSRCFTFSEINRFDATFADIGAR